MNGTDPLNGLGRKKELVTIFTKAHNQQRESAKRHDEGWG